MNVHFVRDSVYIERFIAMNNTLSSGNVYISLDQTQKHISNENVIFIERINKKNIFTYLLSATKRFFSILRYIKKADRIYFHCLEFIHCIFLPFIRKKQKTYWLVWGIDVYNRVNYKLFDEETIKYYDRPHKKNKFKHILEKHLIKKINYIGTIINGDYNLLAKEFGLLNNCIQFFYANPLHFESINEIPQKPSSHIILLGNSGDPTNNHISVLNSIPKLDDLKIYCPLSYGEKDYIKKVISHGKELFNNSFIPLVDFMPPEEYLELLNSVDICIMNHFRQQALGNIFAVLALGKKVYLNTKSPVYDFLISKGFVIEQTDYLLENKVIDFSKYEESVIERNRILTYELNSEEQTKKYIENLYV